MDPQQRYVLDCVHMAMEDGGLTKKEVSGSNTGVYIGIIFIYLNFLFIHLFNKASRMWILLGLSK